MKDEAGMLAMVDAFAFLLIVTSVCAAVPMLSSQEEQATSSFQDLVRNLHVALLGANTTDLPGGGADLPLWRYAELTLAALDPVRSEALLSGAAEILRFLGGAIAWEWTCGMDLSSGQGSLVGNLYCDRVLTSSGVEFALRLAPNGVPP